MRTEIHPSVARLDGHLRAHGDGRCFRVPDVQNGLRWGVLVRRKAAVIAVRRAIGRVFAALPRLVRADFHLCAVVKCQKGAQHEAAASLGILADLYRHHPHAGEEEQRLALGFEVCLISVERASDRLVTDKISADAGRPRAGGAPVDVQLTGRVAAESNMSSRHDPVKGVAFLEFGDRVIALRCIGQGAVDCTLAVRVARRRQPDPLVFPHAVYLRSSR